jgi:hypothetical protein
MKREVLFTATTRQNELEDAILNLYTVCKARKDGQEWANEHSVATAMTPYSNTSHVFDESRLFVSITCSKTTADVFDNYHQLMKRLANEMSIRFNTEIYDESSRRMFMHFWNVREAIREELGVGRLFASHPLTLEDVARLGR